MYFNTPLTEVTTGRIAGARGLGLEKWLGSGGGSDSFLVIRHCDAKKQNKNKLQRSRK